MLERKHVCPNGAIDGVELGVGMLVCPCLAFSLTAIRPAKKTRKCGGGEQGMDRADKVKPFSKVHNIMDN